MTTLKMPDAASASGDFVSTDAADLASHMRHCANSHSRLFPVYTVLETAHGLASPRIVTVFAVIAAVAAALGLLATA